MKFNQIKWTDTFLDDFEAGRKFYSEIFGWQYVDQHDNGQLVYSLACLNTTDKSLNWAPVAGVGPCNFPKPEDVPWNWGVYILVPNVEEAIEKVTVAGGSICREPMDVMTAGRMGVCMDSNGAVIHLWQPLEHGGSEVGKVPGAVCWVELASRDVQKAIDFYGEAFGWEAEDSKQIESYWYLKDGEDIVGGLHDGIEETGGQEVWVPYFHVEQPHKTVDACRRLGGGVVHGPIQEPGIGTFAILSDLETNLFGVASFE